MARNFRSSSPSLHGKQTRASFTPEFCGTSPDANELKTPSGLASRVWRKHKELLMSEAGNGMWPPGRCSGRRSSTGYLGSCRTNSRPATIVSWPPFIRTTGSEEHTSELQSHVNLVCRLLLEKKQNHA